MPAARGRRRREDVADPRTAARVPAARARPGPRLPDDRRPEQQPDHHRLTRDGEDRLAVPASRRHPPRPVVPRSRRRVLLAGLHVDLDERGIQPADRPDRHQDAPAHLDVRTRRRARLRLRLPVQSGRRVSPAERAVHGRRHPELPRPLHQPRAQGRARDRPRRELRAQPAAGAVVAERRDAAEGRRRARHGDRRLGRPDQQERPPALHGAHADELPVRRAAAPEREHPRRRLQHAGPRRRDHAAREGRLDVRAARATGRSTARRLPSAGRTG